MFFQAQKIGGKSLYKFLESIYECLIRFDQWSDSLLVCRKKTALSRLVLVCWSSFLTTSWLFLAKPNWTPSSLFLTCSTTLTPPPLGDPQSWQSQLYQWLTSQGLRRMGRLFGARIPLTFFRKLITDDQNLFEKVAWSILVIPVISNCECNFEFRCCLNIWLCRARSSGSEAQFTATFNGCRYIKWTYFDKVFFGYSLCQVTTSPLWVSLIYRSAPHPFRCASLPQRGTPCWSHRSLETLCLDSLLPADAVFADPASWRLRGRRGAGLATLDMSIQLSCWPWPWGGGWEGASRSERPQTRGLTNKRTSDFLCFK